MYVLQVENGHIEEPNVCTSCNSDKKPFELVHNQCLFRDRQVRFATPACTLPLPTNTTLHPSLPSLLLRHTRW